MSFTRVLRVETKYEFLKLVRLPAYAVPILIFPLMFYALFGLAFAGRSGKAVTVATYEIAVMGAFGVIGAAMFGLGVSVAGERGQGWMSVKRASPMPMAAYFGAKLNVAVIFGAIIVALLFLLGFAFGHVRLEPSVAATLAGVLILGTIPFCALGLAIGYLAGPNSAQPIVNLVYLPMSFASGLWMPFEMLPKFVKDIAPWLPPYHLSRLALGTVGLDPSSQSSHVIALGGFTLAFLALAALGYRRDEGKTYG
jgi:ABC-2 type transport system permease protein